MRIISEFHDYYDSCMRYQGEAEDGLVYVRKPKEIKFDLGYWGKNFLRYNGNIDTYWYIVGFCGELYPVVEMWWSEWNSFESRTENISKFCYNENDVRNFIESIPRKGVESFFYKKSYKESNFSNIVENFKLQTNRKEYHARLKIKELSDMFYEHSCPIFIYDATYRQDNPNHVTLNWKLENYEFYKIKDTFQAYQDIKMFITNMAQPEKPIPAIADKDMVEIKGFDPKYGFRKPPSK